jgi:hypothetical protein
MVARKLFGSFDETWKSLVERRAPFESLLDAERVFGRVSA